MAGRGRRGPPRRGRGPPRQEYPFQEAEELGSEELKLEGKNILIELKVNDQGKFLKVLEMQQDRSRGRVILSSNKGFELRSILNEFVAEYERLPPMEETAESERIKTESFNQGRRRYYVDLRQNQRGRFVKITMLAGNKTFVAIPGDALCRFRDSLAKLLDQHCSEGEESGGMAESSGGGGGGGGGSRPPPQQRSTEQRSPQTVEKVLPSKEVRAGGKRFYFDVEQNERGTFIKLSEVLNSGRRNRINIPQICWTKMSDTFGSYAKDLPMPSGEEDSAGSGSDDN